MAFFGLPKGSGVSDSISFLAQGPFSQAMFSISTLKLPLQIDLGELLNITFPTQEGFKITDNNTIIVLEVGYYLQLEKILRKTHPRYVWLWSFTPPFI